VAEQMTTEDSTVVALLHDVVEDTNYTMADLARLGFKKEVLDALELLTHDKDVPYLEYVAKLKDNRIAREVKLADLAHNSDVSRLPKVTSKDWERVEKYKKAMALLKEGD
jgi:(p)ppGpp synthase/HD superfamily hydrolase